MSDEVRDHNEQVLRKIDRVDRVHKFFKSIGSSDEQASTAAAAHAEKFVWDGAVLSFQGKPVADADNGVREYFESHNLGFLLPPKSANADKPDIDPALLASARAGNKTAYQNVYLKLGRDKAATDALIADKGTGAGADDTRQRDEHGRFVADKASKFKGTNPWGSGPGEWNVTRQGQLCRELGLAAAQSIAASAGSFVGATKPSKAA